MASKRKIGSMAKKMVGASYEEFKKIITGSKSVVDDFISVDSIFDDALNKAKAHKVEIDAGAKEIKEAKVRLRGFLGRMFEEKGVEKIEGIEFKSITFRPEKTVKEVVSDRQIKIKNKYVSLSELDKDALVEAMQGAGFKVRVVSDTKDVVKPASVRLNR